MMSIEGPGGLPLFTQQKGNGLQTSVPLTFNGAVTFNGTQTSNGAQSPIGGENFITGSAGTPRTFSTGGRGVTSLTAPHSTAFVTTDTYIAEIFIPQNVTVTGVSVLMGTGAGNGNLTVGLANSAGAVVASSPTTTTSGTSTTFTKIALTTPYVALGPATYYVLVQGSSTSDLVGTHVAGNFGASLQTSQTYGTLTAITAPTTFTANQGPVADLY